MSSLAPGRKPSLVRQQRERKGWTQVQLAVRAGCSLSTVGAAERFGYLSRQMARRFAEVLDCRPEELLAPASDEVGR